MSILIVMMIHSINQMLIVKLKELLKHNKIKKTYLAIIMIMIIKIKLRQIKIKKI